MESQIENNINQTVLFKELQNYDWENNREFQIGLSAILGPSPSPSQKHELTLRAQCFFYARKKGIPIDFDAYKSYLSSQSSTAPLNAPPSSAPTEPVPPLQQAPSQIPPPTTSSFAAELGLQPRTTPLPTSYRTSRDLFSSPSDYPFGSSSASATADAASPQPKSTSFQPSSNPNGAPYPASFAEIVELIQSGAPIPGVEDIDPTVAWGQGSKPVMKARRKPWEMHLTEDQVQPGYWGGTFGNSRDQTPIQQELPDGEEPEFKGPNWWKVVEAQEQEKSEGSRDQNAQ